jgi:hypothetical protein
LHPIAQGAQLVQLHFVDLDGGRVIAPGAQISALTPTAQKAPHSGDEKRDGGDGCDHLEQPSARRCSLLGFAHFGRKLGSLRESIKGAPGELSLGAPFLKTPTAAAVRLALDQRLRRRYRPASITSPEASITVLPGSGRKWKAICQDWADAHVIWIGSFGLTGTL